MQLPAADISACVHEERGFASGFEGEVPELERIA